MDKNFKNKDYQDYIDGELDIKVPLPDLIFGKGHGGRLDHKWPSHHIPLQQKKIEFRK